MSTRFASLLLVSAVLNLALPSAQQQEEKIDGYAEFYDGDAVVVDGQRVVITPSTRIKVKGARVTRARDVPLGFDVLARGTRDAWGRVIAREFKADANASEMFEGDVHAATSELEGAWLQAGAVIEPKDDGGMALVGRLVPHGRQVDRAQRIADRLLPAYVTREAIRVHVVDTPEWNAMAMGNGAVWVYTGLLESFDDDEVAIVIGHELAHYTHEHTRKSFKRAFWGELIAAGIVAATEQVDSTRTRELLNLTAAFSMMAWQSGYGRDLEDQADRVGMRYAHAAGFDVSKGPGVWQRFLHRYGESDKVTNFFFGSHSRSSDRIVNLRRELARNYAMPTESRR